MGKQSPEEIRREVLEEDSKKDVSIYLAVPVGVIAGLSAMAAVCAVISTRALVYFRQGVDAYWLSCVPFLFPVITGLFSAYKKQFSLLGVHLTVTLLALLMGGFGFALSIDPIFVNRAQCVRVSSSLDCEKTTLVYLYLVCGAVAAAFAVLGFLLTLCGLNSAASRMAHRRHEAEVLHLREQAQKQQDLHHMKKQNELRPRTLSATSNTAPDTTAANGIPQVPQGATTVASNTKTEEKVTTKL